MTVETPRSPTSPISPTFAHPLDDGFSPRQPQLQVITTFPMNSVLGRRPSLSFTTVPSANALSSPASPNSGFRAHRSHRRAGSNSSNLSFPSPIEAILMQPLSNLPTPPTPNARMTIDMLLNPTPTNEMDGRQSRMAMRGTAPMSAFSPMSLCTPTPITAIRSPILEQVVSLPLRAHTVHREATAPASPMEMDSDMSFSSNATTAIPSRPESRTGSRASSRSRWNPTHTRSPAISHPPHNGLTSTRERSPIRKSVRKRSPPPQYHVNVQPGIASTLNGPPTVPQMSPRTAYEYRSAISHLSTPLVPLISVTTGLSHPHFPRSLLQYHLLTHEQLDSLARWYHQVQPQGREAFMYPGWIPPYTTHSPTRSFAVAGGNDYKPSSPFADVSLATKRRRWGRFIGLRGCESPVREGFEAEAEEEGLVERMEREWANAIRRAREEEMVREKGWRGRW